jgi:hypothetical protein
MAMRAVVVLMALSLSVPASAQTQTVMYIRPPRAVLCDRLDLAKIAVQVASDAYRTGRAAGRYPVGCATVAPNKPVVVLDQFGDYAYVGIDAGDTRLPPRVWVHVGALSETPEGPPPKPSRRRR